MVDDKENSEVRKDITSNNDDDARFRDKDAEMQVKHENNIDVEQSPQNQAQVDQSQNQQVDNISLNNEQAVEAEKSAEQTQSEQKVEQETKAEQHVDPRVQEKKKQKLIQKIAQVILGQRAASRINPAELGFASKIGGELANAGAKFSGIVSKSRAGNLVATNVKAQDVGKGQDQGRS